MEEIKVGDLISVSAAGSNNHGCQDYAILCYLGDNRGEVVECQSCHSCWQVGHDAAHIFARIGQVWKLDTDEIVPASSHWSVDVEWELV